MTSFVEANGLRFAYLEQGPADGPLALCLHGFPDHAPTWRHLAPMLADEGYRVVMPWMRGYAPTQVPEGRTISVRTLATDALALHRALGGDGRAVLIGHDWGASATWRAGAVGADRFRALVGLAVPPDAAMVGLERDLGQLRNFSHMALFQLPFAERLVRRDDYAFIEKLWRDWSPGHVPDVADMRELKATLDSPGSLSAALGYYRALPKAFVDGAYSSDTATPQQPSLYLQGRDDACVEPRYLDKAADVLPAGSWAELLDDCGHFLHLERPELVGRKILEFLARV